MMPLTNQPPKSKGIAVVIPHYSNSHDMAVLLMQLQQQTVKPTHIYLADNSENGNGMRLAQRYQWNTPIFVDQKVGNIYKSWNEGIRFSWGMDVFVLNDDILIPKDFIEQMMLKKSNAYAVCPLTSGFPPVGTIRPHYQWHHSSHLETTFADEPTETYLPFMRGWCFMLPFATYSQVGLFDEEFQIWFGDTDYDRRLMVEAKKTGRHAVCYVPVPVHHYGTSSFSKIGKKRFFDSNYQDQLRFEWKHRLAHHDLGWDSYAKKD